MRNLIFILGDQLSFGITSLEGADPDRDHILMAEVADEATYVPHHKKKIAFVFAAMRHFADALRAKGFEVTYSKLDDAGNSRSLSGELARACHALKADKVIMTEPGEWRVQQVINTSRAALGRPLEVRPDKRFVCSRAEFASWAEGRKQLRMEYFYREMRKKTGLLMEDGQPAGGKWNFDADNRKPARADLFMPAPLRFDPDPLTRTVLDLVEARFSGHFGDLQPFWFAVTPDQARMAFDHFCKTALPRFGDYQDAMLRGEKFLYHSVISLYLNAGLLDPLDLCRKAEDAYIRGHAPLNAVEGFIRQILGWREYVRGIYWLKMPDYAESNFFGADRPLPDFYWTGESDMLCLAEAVGQTRDEAYAHHIQRLMVTGNFALLAGIAPKAVHEWYLSVYADAYEWVELPNTLGMSQFADGGLLGSKPYVSGGNYIHKMSDYCASCRYDVKTKTGPDACPFNSLYWHFLDRNATKLRANPRLAQVYRTWEKMGGERQAEYLRTAEAFLTRLDNSLRV
ncbi:(6-4) photolyase [Roseibium aquae]|uniref:(6-4) photolyase n=1 Tax=Roseibium aquae TaxID=1323746 RepID=A0A916X1X5_9HYPH|nr:cryptochrome/photolyase family protein [Roseibium aquae]GGB48218.1 (6-4) photolyase [Roseibium aquae]